MKKKAMAGIALFLAFTVLLTGCGRAINRSYSQTEDGGSYGSARETWAAMDIAEDMDLEYEAEEAALGSSQSMAAKIAPASEEADQKIVWSGYLRIDSTEYEKTMREIQALIRRYQAQVESSEEYDGASWYGGDTSSRVMSWQLRIPSESFQGFFEDAGELSGQIRSKSTSSSDMTKQYNDTSIQIESLTIQQDNLMEMMKKAIRIEDMLAIEERLAEVRSELRILTNANTRIDYDVAWSAISVELQEVHVYQKENITYLQRLRQAAGNSLVEFVEALGDFSVGLLYAIPYLLVLALLILLGRKLFRRHRQKKLENSGEGRS